MSPHAAPGCSHVRAKFADYLDSRLTGLEMQSISTHIEDCSDCATEFNVERGIVRALTSLGPVSGSAKEPADMVLRIRVALSQERAKKRNSSWASTVARWELAYSRAISAATVSWFRECCAAVRHGYRSGRNVCPSRTRFCPG
jgi:anti-sigma factor RsiW